jgi:hypothetical protein
VPSTTTAIEIILFIALELERGVMVQGATGSDHIEIPGSKISRYLDIRTSRHYRRNRE